MRPIRSRLAPALALALALAAGCGGGEHAGATVTAPPAPQLVDVDVAPGVQVVADYDEPIFYVDGYYWWAIGGAWYRSASYTGGWVRVAMPPTALLRIEHPHRYRHYQADGR